MNDLFVPDSYVPVSGTFVSQAGQASAGLSVSRPLLTALVQAGHKLYVAWDSGGSIVYSDDLLVDLEHGAIRFQTMGRGCHTIVSGSLCNAYPITTNWSAELHQGRGGAAEGAADGMGWIEWDRQEGVRRVRGWFRNTDEGSPYSFESERYALFAEDDALARTPAYERYVGETYSLYSVSEEVALQLSAETLAHSGYPVLICCPDTPLEELETVPAFQLVHNVIIGKGQHRSLATYILPPFWRSGSSGGYPALFSGFYDQNENVFSTVGPELLKVMGELYTERAAGVVGIIWNGGGSIGSRTLQQSVYANLDDLFERAIRTYNVHCDGIVTVGGSRGGITSLLAAANPSQESYRVRYAVCHNIPFLFGSPLQTMLNSSHPILDQAMCEDTGYKDAWRKEWRDDLGRSGMELFLETTMGTSDLHEIDRAGSPYSGAVLERLAANGTQLWLNHGTHDPFTASWLTFRWVARARALGVPVRHEIGYRFGHNNCVNLYDSAKRCLVSILTGEPLTLGGTFHYARASEVSADWSRAVRLAVEHQPVFFEGPKVVIRGAANDFALYGVPGMDYRLLLEPAQRQADDVDLVVMEGQLQPLPGIGSDFSYATCYRDLSSHLGQKMYRYRLHYRLPGAVAWRDDLQYTPQPDHLEPTLQLLEEQPNPLQPEWILMTLQHFIGWGLSEV